MSLGWMLSSGFLKTRAKIETMIRQGVNFQDERFDLLITGNPGTC